MDRDRLVRELQTAAAYERVAEIRVGTFGRTLSEICADAAAVIIELPEESTRTFVCPACQVTRDETLKTAVFWDGKPACGFCARAVRRFRTAIASVPR